MAKEITVKFVFQSCLWFTNPCGRQCEGRSHQPGGSVPLTSTEAPLPPPAHRRVESAGLQKWCLFLNFGNKISCFTQLRRPCTPSLSLFNTERIIARRITTQNGLRGNDPLPRPTKYHIMQWFSILPGHFLFFFGVVKTDNNQLLEQLQSAP